MRLKGVKKNVIFNPLFEQLLILIFVNNFINLKTINIFLFYYHNNYNLLLRVMLL